MSSVEEQRKRLKREWDNLKDPKPSWEEWKRMSVKKRNTFLYKK